MSTEINNLSFNEKDLATIAKKIVELKPECRIFLFEGEMGSGKTTLIKEICKQLGSTDNFSSPSFSIINEYHSTEGKIFHIDLYRIKNKSELFDLGIDQYLDSGNYCFIEWPQMAEDIIDGKYMRIIIQSKDNIRYLSAQYILNS